MQEGAHHRAEAAADGVAEHACGRAAEEVRHHAGQNQHPVQFAEDKEADEATGEAGEEADQHRIRCIGEDDGAIERRARVRHQFLREAGEGGDNFGEDEAHALQDDEHARGEGNRLDDRPDKVVLPFAVLALHEVLPGGDDQHEVDDHHGERDGNGAVAQEAEVFRQVHFFGGARFAAQAAPDQPRQHVADRAEMAEADFVAAGDVAHEGLGDEREKCHDQAETERADQHQMRAFKTGDDEDDRNHARHIERVVAGEEDEFEAGEAGDGDVCHHAKRHDERGRRAVFLQRGGDDGFVVRHHALHVERLLENVAERIERAEQHARAAAQNDEAEDGLDGALDDIGDGLFLRNQTDEGDDADQHGRHLENIDDEVEQRFHESLLVAVEVNRQLALKFVGADEVVDDDDLAALNAGAIDNVRAHHEQVGVAGGGDGEVGVGDFRFNS